MPKIHFLERNKIPAFILILKLKAKNSNYSSYKKIHSLDTALHT